MLFPCNCPISESRNSASISLLTTNTLDRFVCKALELLLFTRKDLPMKTTIHTAISSARSVMCAKALCVVALASTLGACAPTREVSRVDPRVPVDVDYRFNDVDARQIYQGMVADALARPWIDNHMAENGGRRPVVIVGPVKNATSDNIDTLMITTDIERELINSGRVRFVAMKDQRIDIREERADQQEWATPATRKQMRAELGADYIVLGRIMDDKPRSLSGSSGVSYFKCNLEVINLETNEKVWIGSQEVKKVWRDR
jgi:penicillin-binding protein activator